MKKALVLVSLALALTCAADQPMPPAPPGMKMKVKALAMPAPAVQAPYFVSPGFNGPLICPVSDGTNVLFSIPAGAPQVYVPNITQASFAVLQSSPNLGAWTTVAYFTNLVNGLLLVDSIGTNQFKFYRLVPQ